MQKILYILPFILFIQCTKHHTDDTLKNKYEINGNVIENQGFEKVYLSYYVQDNFILMDSAPIKKNSFHFKGKITYPKKAQLQVYQNGGFFPFILGGEKIDINLNINNLSSSSVENSILNTEWNQIKNHSYEIFGSVDYYFPLMQKARMQNDYQTLEKLSYSIDSIENENRKYLLDYVNTHINSSLSPLIINDLFKNKGKDSLQIIETARKLSPDFKNALEFNIP